jgi:hypothetical protein
MNQGQITYISNISMVLTGTPSYSPQWSSKAPGAGSYSNVTGGNTWNYSFSTNQSTAIGTWFFELNVTDSAGVHVVVTSSPVTVIVNDVPQFSSPANNVTYTYGQVGNQLSWTISDSLSSSRSYTIDVNNSVNGTGTWTAGTPITVDVDNLLVGWYNFSITVTDGYGGSNSSWAYVIVNNDIPQISQPANITYTYGQAGQTVSWTITDGAYTTTSWILKVNNTLNATGSWSPGIPVVINVTGLWVGWANYSLTVNDGLNGINSSWAIVTVLDDVPTLNHPYNGLFSIPAGISGNVITWVVTDGAYVNATWAVYNNVTGPYPHFPNANATGNWSSGSPININVDGLPLGIWNWTLVAWDGLGLNSSYEVDVVVSNNPTPTISQPADVLMQFGATGFTITWSITDYSNNTANATYWVYQNTTNLVGTGLWALPSSSNSVTVALSGLAVGMYNYTLIADNGDGIPR